MIDTNLEISQKYIVGGGSGTGVKEGISYISAVTI
jgi:hypothetical protein